MKMTQTFKIIFCYRRKIIHLSNDRGFVLCHVNYKFRNLRNTDAMIFATLQQSCKDKCTSHAIRNEKKKLSETAAL